MNRDYIQTDLCCPDNPTCLERKELNELEEFKKLFFAIMGHIEIVNEQEENGVMYDAHYVIKLNGNMIMKESLIGEYLSKVNREEKGGDN